MSYGHAGALLADGSKDVLAELRIATNQLGRWAALNPGLVNLHRDFDACLRDLGKCTITGGK